MSCIGCCKALKPRYKRLVDDLYPVNPEDGLVKNSMEKLVHYALSSPEKLDRIGEYLTQRLSRDVARRRFTLVKIAMDALDQLLVSCHDYSLNLFVESFLKMVQKLLECDELELQILATSSFVKYSNIEEDAPSYHRRYDFFVSKFSSMCHSSMDNEVVRAKIRGAGLKGLQGVVKKTVSDDLQVNIWEPIHMDKIVPSLLYNMHDPSFVPVDIESPKDEEHPAQVAETVFRDLLCRASYGNIKAVLKPVLVHMDNHKLWTPKTFSTKCFKIIMYSVQQQYAYVVIQALMSHLDSHVRAKPDVKVAIVEVLFESVLIAAGASIGPSVLDVFNTLVKHLRFSLDNKSGDEGKRSLEKKFEEAVINTIGQCANILPKYQLMEALTLMSQVTQLELCMDDYDFGCLPGQFASNLPDYQKIEIMMFVMAKFPQFTAEEDIGIHMDSQLQTMLLKTLLKVATKYKTVTMSNAFPPEFLQPLLRMSLLTDPGMRIIVQEILHTLIDRHDNTPKLRHLQVLKDIGKVGIKGEKVHRQDILFMKKNGTQFYWYILENVKLETNKVDNFEALYCTVGLISVEMGCKELVVELVRLALDMQLIHDYLENVKLETNKVDNFEALYCTVGLISVEMGCKELVVELVRLALDMQNIATNLLTLPLTHKCAIHSLVSCFLTLLCQLCDLQQLNQYVCGVIDTRRNDAPHLLPDFAFNRKNRPASYPATDTLKDKWLFQQEIMTEILSTDGYDVSRLATPFTQKPFSALIGTDNTDGTISVSDIQSINLDIDSTEGSPVPIRRRACEEVTVESLKKMLAEDGSVKREEEERRRQEILQTFRTAPFEEIVARSEAKSNHFHNKLNEILSMVSKGSDSPGTLRKKSDTPATIFDIQFPELYVY